MKLGGISEGKTKPQESTGKHLDVVEEVSTLVPSKQERQSSQLQVSRDAQELNPHATEDNIACAVEDEADCKCDSEQSNTLDTSTSPYSKTSNIADCKSAPIDMSERDADSQSHKGTHDHPEFQKRIKKPILSQKDAKNIPFNKLNN